jgi:hypothetical protein
MVRVRTPSKNAKDTDTNKRLHQIFQKYLAEARMIVVDVADIGPFEVNGIHFDSHELGDRFKRRALENLLLVIGQQSNEFELLNMVVDPVEEAREKLLKLPPHKLRELMKLYGLDKPE